MNVDIELLDKYVEVCDRLWRLNQAYVKQNLEYLRYEQERKFKRENNCEDLPF